MIEHICSIVKYKCCFFALFVVDNLNMDFWERLKIEVKKKNTTQEWLATETNIPFGTLRKWLSNKTMPNADQAYAIAKALGVTVEYLLTGSDSITDPWVRENRRFIDDCKKLGPDQFMSVQRVVASFIMTMQAIEQSRHA